MTERAEHRYEFAGFRFSPSERLLVRLRDGHPFGLTPKENDLLLSLVRSSGKIVSYDELKKEVWPESPHVLTHTIRETKHTLSKILGETAGRLETVAGKGYRLNVAVVTRQNDCADDHDAGRTDVVSAATAADRIEGAEQMVSGSQVVPATPSRTGGQLARSFAGHLWHVLVSCTIYALLYTIALFVELAYQFDRFAILALKLALPIFVWIYATSMFGLLVDWKKARRGEATGLIFTILSFTGSGLLLYAALGFFLPNIPITEANFQTYTAHGAYLKSVAYFSFLAIVFLIIPFHFVLSLQREMQAGRHKFVFDLLTGERRGSAPRGAIYLKVWWLGLFLFVATVSSPVVVAHLFENLKPGPHVNLFMQLVEWRVLTYLALGLECLLWYYRRLNEIKRECSESGHKTG